MIIWERHAWLASQRTFRTETRLCEATDENETEQTKIPVFGIHLPLGYRIRNMG